MSDGMDPKQYRDFEDYVDPKKKALEYLGWAKFNLEKGKNVAALNLIDKADEELRKL